MDAALALFLFWFLIKLILFSAGAAYLGDRYASWKASRHAAAAYEAMDVVDRAEVDRCSEQIDRWENLLTMRYNDALKGMHR